MNYQPGQLDRQITLQRNTPTTSAVGQRVESWSTAATVWGMVEELGGDERAEDRNIISPRRIKVTIRYLSGLKNTWRVVYGGENYEIMGTPVEIGRRHWHQITCERLGEQTYE